MVPADDGVKGIVVRFGVVIMPFGVAHVGESVENGKEGIGEGIYRHGDALPEPDRCAVEQNPINDQQQDHDTVENDCSVRNGFVGVVIQSPEQDRHGDFDR